MHLYRSRTGLLRELALRNTSECAAAYVHNGIGIVQYIEQIGELRFVAQGEG